MIKYINSYPIDHVSVFANSLPFPPSPYLSSFSKFYYCLRLNKRTGARESSYFPFNCTPCTLLIMSTIHGHPELDWLTGAESKKECKVFKLWKIRTLYSPCQYVPPVKVRTHMHLQRKVGKVQKATKVLSAGLTFPIVLRKKWVRSLG